MIFFQRQAKMCLGSNHQPFLGLVPDIKNTYESEGRNDCKVRKNTPDVLGSTELAHLQRAMEKRHYLGVN
jgi:hypothetical protein